jgi:hypothetical protein
MGRSVNLRGSWRLRRLPDQLCSSCESILSAEASVHIDCKPTIVDSTPSLLE